MNQSRRNCRKRSLRRTRRRGGVVNTKFVNMQVENWINFNKNANVGRSNSRIHANIPNVPYTPNQGSFGFKRTGFSAKQNPKNYNCLELRTLVDNSHNRKKLTEAEVERVKAAICFPQKDKNLENTRQMAITSPSASTFKAFIEKIRQHYSKKS